MVIGGLGRQTALAQTDKSEVGMMMPNGFVARNDCWGACRKTLAKPDETTR